VLPESLDSEQVTSNDDLVWPVWLIATRGPFFTGLASGHGSHVDVAVSARAGIAKPGGIFRISL
jgi:hypothetical protein